MTAPNPGATWRRPRRRRTRPRTDGTAVRRRTGRAAARLAAVRARGRRHAGGHGLPDRLRRLPVAAALRPALPGRRPSSSGWRTTPPCSPPPSGGQAFWVTAVHHRRLGGHRARPRHGAGPGRCTARSSAGDLVRTAILIPYGIVTVVAAFSWQYAWTPSTGYLPSCCLGERPADRAVAGHRCHHPRRGVEDHAVHGPAAAGGTGPGARGPAARRPRSTGRRPGSASPGSRCR